MMSVLLQADYCIIRYSISSLSAIDTISPVQLQIGIKTNVKMKEMGCVPSQVFLFIK